MTILHAMSISGSIAVIIYFILHPLAQKRLPVLWHKIYLTVTIFLFIIPFPYIGIFQNTVGWLNSYLQSERLKQEGSLFYNESGNTIIKFNNAVYAYNWQLYIIISACLLLSTYFLVKLIIKYARIYKSLKNISEKCEMADTDLNALCQRIKAPKNVKVYSCDRLGTPLTIGIMRGRIILPNTNWENGRLEDALHHELVHIKSKDNLIKLILLIAVIVNLYNPFVYYLWHKWNLIAEMYCDDKVIEHKSGQEIKNYAKLIIDFAEGNQNVKLPVTGLSIDEKQLKERIMNMKRTRKNYGVISKVIGTAIIIFAVLASSSLSVLAYTPRSIVCLDEDYEGGEIETMVIIGSDVYPNELDMRLKSYEKYISHDDMTIFVDDEGNAYYDMDSGKTSQTYAGCSHTYDEVTITKHVKNSGSSCTVDYYNGKRCSKCGNVIYGSHIAAHSYVVCPH